jgi:hypothetical protein
MRESEIAEDDLPEPPQVRRLRHLVTALVLVLIVGVVTVAATLVIRLVALPAGQGMAAAPVTAERIVLPGGERIVAIGRAGGEIAVATEDGEGVERLRFFDAASGEARSVTRIRRE